MKKLIVFNLVGTLAESKSSIDPQMAALLHDLIGIVKVPVIPVALILRMFLTNKWNSHRIIAEYLKVL